MIVSVCVQTYNHVRFIRECLDSILNQITDFEYEILIGDDSSDDGTKKICIEYANRYPDKIKLSIRDRKDVIYINGRPTGRFNLIQNIKSCSGQFIAICEGDDYWTDPLKLQKQVEFLNANPNCSLVFHKTKKLINGNVVQLRYSVKNPIIDVSDFIMKGSIQIHTSSLMFKRDLLLIKSDFYSCIVGDKYIILMMGVSGKFGFLDEFMSVYRIHNSSIWSPYETQVDFYCNYLHGYFDLLRKFDVWSNGRYRSVVKRKIELDSYSFLKKNYRVKIDKDKYNQFKKNLSLDLYLKLLLYRLVRLQLC